MGYEHKRLAPSSKTLSRQNMLLRFHYVRIGAAVLCSMASNALTIHSLQAAPLSESLGLADAQKASVQAMFDSQFKPALQQIRAKAHADAEVIIDGVMQQAQTKLTPPLTAEQQQDLASMQRARAARAAARAASAAAPGSEHHKGGRWAHHQAGKGNHDPSARLAVALGLTDAQKAQLQTMFAAARPQLKAIRHDARTQSQALMKQYYAQIAQYLTPQQQQDLASMQRIRERMRASWQNRATKES